jgi:hypothetical protein
MMVEVLRRYSNRDDLQKSLVGMLGRIETGDRTDVPGVQSVVNAHSTRSPVRERLSGEALCQLVSRSQDGTPKRVLATDYGISLSSVKRLLRNRKPL